MELKGQGTALSYLDLYANEIGDEGAMVLAEVLPLCPTLSRLGVEDNQIGNEGRARLVGVLPLCPALSLLILASAHVSHIQYGVLYV